MAAPIPSAYTTGFNAGYPVLYVVRLNPAGAAAPLYLVNQNDITDIGLPRALSYDGSSVSSANIYGQYLAVETRGSSVEAIGEIDFNFQMDELGGMAGRNECTIQLLNQGSLSNTLLAYDVDNSSVEIWQGYLKPSGTIAVDSDLILLFKGIVYEWQGWSRELTTLRCFDTQHLYNTKIPQRIITKTNFSNAPDGLVNKPIPILIGDFQTENTASYGNRSSQDIGVMNAAPTVMVNQKTQEIFVSSEPWNWPADNVYWQDGDVPWVAIMHKITTGSLTTISFANTAGVYTIVRSAGSFVTDGFVAEMKVLVDSTSGLNDGVFTVEIVAAGSLTVTQAVTTETAAAAGATVVIAGYNNDGAGSYSLLLGADAYADIYVRPILTTIRNTASSWENCLDVDQTNYAQVGYVSAFNANRKLALKLSDFSDPGQFIGGWQPEGYGGTPGNQTAFKVCFECSNTVGDVRLVVRRLSVSVEDNNVTYIVNGDNTYNLNFGSSSPADTWAALKDYEFRLERASATGYTRVKNVWIKCRSFVDLAQTITIAEPPTINSSAWPGVGVGRRLLLRKDILPARGRTNLYVSCKGIKYGSWIDAGGRSEGHNEGDIIQGVAGVIEYILRELLGVPSAEIDLDSFDVVGNTTTGTRKDWLIASSIGGEQNAFEYIRQMCREFGLILYQDPHDTTGYLRWRLVSLPTTSSAVTGTVTDSILDVDESGHPTQFYVSFTPHSNIKNDIYLNYKKNYVTDKFDKGVYLSAVAGDGVMATNLTSNTGALRGTTYTAWMSLSQTKYDNASTATYDLEFVRDVSTAEYLLKLLADWFAFRRMRVTMNLTRNLTTLTWRIGDVLQITHTLLGTNHSGVSKFMITGMNYPAVGETVPPYITIECEEIPSAITGART